jgi:hypothetical protein
MQACESFTKIRRGRCALLNCSFGFVVHVLDVVAARYATYHAHLPHEDRKLRGNSYLQTTILATKALHFLNNLC